MRRSLVRIYAVVALLLASVFCVAVPARAAQTISGTVNASSLSSNSDITLSGDTTIVISKGDNVTVGFIDCSYHSLTIRGSNEGTLTSKGGINVGGDALTIKGGTVKVTGEHAPGNNSYCIICVGNFTMTGGVLDLYNPGDYYRWSTYGLYVMHDFTMSGGEIRVRASSSSKYCHGISVLGNGTISGGVIDVKAYNSSQGGAASGIGTASGSDVTWSITGGKITAEGTAEPDTSYPGHVLYEGYGIYLSNSSSNTNIISGNAEIDATGTYHGFSSIPKVSVSGDAHISCEGTVSGFAAGQGIAISERAYIEAWSTKDHPIYGGNGSITFASTHEVTNPSGGYVGTYSGVDYHSGSCVLTSDGNIPSYVCIKRTANIPMYRLYNQWTGEHFYTASNQERDNLTSVGWKYEGIGWTAPPSGQTVYRLYNPWIPGGDHHYTRDADEYQSCINAGWTGEGFAWYSRRAPAGHYQGVPVYREFNPYATTGSHNYTTDINEHNHLISVGWRDEGVAWYGV